MSIGLHVKHMLFLSHFNETWIFSKDFRKILKYHISWQSVQLKPSCSMLTDGQADMTKQIVAFHNFANAPKMCGTRRLTPRSWVLPEKLTVSQLVKKFPAFYGTLRFITTFTTAHSNPLQKLSFEAWEVLDDNLHISSTLIIRPSVKECWRYKEILLPSQVGPCSTE
jgi:hypothetical protein